MVIRFFMGGWALCDGKCPGPLSDVHEDGDLYIGNLVRVFGTWEEADGMRKIIDAEYGL